MSLIALPDSLPGKLPLFQDLRDDSGAHGAAALPDREPKLLLHGHRSDQLHRPPHVVPRHHHLPAPRKRRHPHPAASRTPPRPGPPSSASDESLKSPPRPPP